MILEQRVYSIRTGKMPAFLEQVEQCGMPIARRVLGGGLGYFTEEIGDLNRVTHLWAYESLTDREQRLAAIVAIPEWLAFVDAVLPLIEHMETRILRPAAFSPLTLEIARQINR